MYEMEMEDCLPKTNYKQDENVYNKNENICIRCMRKKFKCIIIFLLLLITIAQIFVILLEKLNDNQIEMILSKIVKKTQNSSIVYGYTNQTHD